MSEGMIERVARAIAEHGFGQPWDDFLELSAFDTDQNDIFTYARAAIEAMRDCIGEDSISGIAAREILDAALKENADDQ